GAVLHWDGTTWKTTSTRVTNTSLLAIWGSGPSDVWAAGQPGFTPGLVQSPSGGGLVHWDGEGVEPRQRPPGEQSQSRRDLGERGRRCLGGRRPGGRPPLERRGLEFRRPFRRCGQVPAGGLGDEPHRRLGCG